MNLFLLHPVQFAPFVPQNTSFSAKAVNLESIPRACTGSKATARNNGAPKQSYKTKSARYLSLIVLILSAIYLISPVQATPPAFTSTNDIELGDQHSVFVYTQEFAERFNLPRESVTDLDPGLLAMEVLIERFNDQELLKFNDAWYLYICRISLYLDSNLDLLLPLGKWSDARAYFRLINQLRSQLPEMSNNDLQTLIGVNEFDGRAILISRETTYFDRERVPAAGIGLNYEQSYENVFPGITYVHFSSYPLCEHINDEYGGKVIWLEKIGGKDYTDIRIGGIFPFDPDEFYEFSIPTDITESLYLHQALAINEDFMQARLKKLFPEEFNEHA